MTDFPDDAADQLRDLTAERDRMQKAVIRDRNLLPSLQSRIEHVNACIAALSKQGGA